MTKINNSAGAPILGLIIFLPLTLWQLVVDIAHLLMTLLLIAVPAGIIGLALWGVIRWAEGSKEDQHDKLEADVEPKKVIRLADYI